MTHLTRRDFTLGLAGAIVLTAAGCAAPDSGGGKPAAQPGANIPDKPTKPANLTILDVAGNLQLTQTMIDEFVQKNPDTIAKVTYSKAPAPELAGKIKAQQDANQVQIQVVLTGTDGLAAGIAKNLWVKTTDYTAKLPDLGKIYQDPAAKMQGLAQNQGIAVVYYPSGPLYEYNGKAVTDPPTSPQALLDWAKAHPNRFQYADPANSGPGRTLLMGLPYLLGDSDPKDPDKGWDKTWAYLKDLGQYVPYYASGTTETMKNLASGSVDMIASTTGWYINPRALKTVPAEMKVGHFDNMTWVTDAQYVCIPNGVDTDTLAAVFALVRWMLTPEQQAKAYDKGYFYPGPAVKGVTLSMAPKESQDVVAQYGVPEFDQWIDKFPKQPSLPADKQVAAFDKWNREIGAGKKKS